MDRLELKAMIAAGPVKICMNDGKVYKVAAPDEALITDIAAYVLYRSASDNKLRAMTLPLVTMSGVEPIAQ
jgi:hypothetical protein